VVPGFADAATYDAMLARAVALSRAHARGERLGTTFLGYTEIVDYDFTGAVPVLMEAGDLLVFDSHLMHCSTDNVSTGVRAAMVYHFAAAGTVDQTYARLRDQADAMGEMPEHVQDAAAAGESESPYFWEPVRRAGAAV
jgi:ectoine hydroxylase-related dioxygenase (phytanoyl-CoA dioxygenase family)